MLKDKGQLLLFTKHTTSRAKKSQNYLHSGLLTWWTFFSNNPFEVKTNFRPFARVRICSHFAFTAPKQQGLYSLISAVTILCTKLGCSSDSPDVPRVDGHVFALSSSLVLTATTCPRAACVCLCSCVSAASVKCVCVHALCMQVIYLCQRSLCRPPQLNPNSAFTAFLPCQRAAVHSE